MEWEWEEGHSVFNTVEGELSDPATCKQLTLSCDYQYNSNIWTFARDCKHNLPIGIDMVVARK